MARFVISLGIRFNRVRSLLRTEASKIPPGGIRKGSEREPGSIRSLLPNSAKGAKRFLTSS